MPRHSVKAFSGTIGTRDEIAVGNLVRRTRTWDDEDAGGEDAANEDAGPSMTRALYDKMK